MTELLCFVWAGQKVEQFYNYHQRTVDMHMCILHGFKNISRELMDYSTKLALMGLIEYSDIAPHKL